MDRSEDDLALPLEVTDINADWMTAALRYRYPDVEVESVAVVDVMPGSATKVRIAVDYSAAGSDLPGQMIVKAGFNDLRQLLAQVYQNEVTFYRDVAPSAQIPLPRCYFAGSNPETGQSLLLLEDLAASKNRFGRITEALTPDLAGEALDLLAAMHAAYWNRTDDPAMAALTPAGRRPIVEMLTSPQNWERCVGLGRMDELPAAVHDRQKVKEAIRETLIERPGPKCLIHGDVHLGNMYFTPQGAPRFLDFQVAAPGTWAQDAAYFIACSVETDTRREYERSLITGYLESLRAYGVDAPSFGDAWTEYRRHVVWGLLGLLCIPEMQDEEFCRVMGGRFARAIDDLDSLTVAA